MPAALTQQAELRRRQKFQLSHQTITTPMATGATGAGAQLVAQHPQGVVCFEALNRRIKGIGHVCLHTAEPRPQGRSSHATANGLIVIPAPLPTATHGDIVHTAMTGGGNAPGQRRRQRPQHRIDNASRGFDIARDDCSGINRIHQTAALGPQGDGPKQTRTSGGVIR